MAVGVEKFKGVTLQAAVGHVQFAAPKAPPTQATAQDGGHMSSSSCACVEGS